MNLQTDEMSRNPHEPTDGLRKQVEAMSGYGVPEIDIARVVGIDPKTLRKYYREELDTGHTKANARVAESLYKKATTDGSQSVTAAIFWLKTRAGWKETVVNQHAGDPNNPVRQVIEIIDPTDPAR
jgi:hypothetical protein